MRRTALILAFAIQAAPGLSQQSPCHPDDIGITVCPEGKIEKRIIIDTYSPNKSYGIAWKTGEGRTGQDYELFEGPPRTRFAGDDTDTFLVRLADGKTLGKLKATHQGDKPRYNHLSQHVAWSPDERWLISLNDSKWMTHNADAYHVGSDSVSKPLDLRLTCKDAERRYFKSVGRKVNVERFDLTLSIKSIDNDGTVQALCYLQVRREDESYLVAVRLKLADSTKGITATINSVKRCASDQETGPCALVA